MRRAQPIASGRSSLPSLLAIAAVAFGAAGCAESGGARPDGQRPEIEMRPGFARGGDPTVIAVRKIANQDGKLLGYLKVREEPGESRTKGYPKPIVRSPVRVNWVYDPNWKRRGFYTDQGDTYLLGRDGEVEPSGIHGLDDAKLVILGIFDRQPLELLPMDEPRTLEGDRERERAEREAREAAAKKAAEAGGAEGEKKPEGGS